MTARNLAPLRVGCLGSLILVGTILLNCSDDSSVGPEEPKDYVVWCHDETRLGWYFGHHLVTGQVDSFFLEHQSYYGLWLSADGSQLYAVDPDGLGIIDVASQSLLEVIPSGELYGVTNFAFSPDGQYVAFLGLDLNIFTFPDRQPVFHDTANAWTGVFSSDGNRFYCLDFYTSAPRVIHLDSGTIEQFSPMSPRVVQILPTADESTWLIYQQEGFEFGWFSEYDPVRDTILFSDAFRPAAGVIARTPDDRYAFYSTPGTGQEGTPPPSNFRIYDLANHRFDRLFSTVGIADGVNPTYLAVSFLYVSPDGRWLFGSSKEDANLFVIDIEKIEVVRFYDVGDVQFSFFRGPSKP